MSTQQTTAQMVVQMTDAQRVAAGLRQLADLLDANPDLPGTRYAFASINLFPRTREGVAAWARAAMRSTGKARKHQEVCERIVTGTHEVTKDVPDPEILATVPLVPVTETVEDVEWRCMPLLSELDSTPAVTA